jgi:hypothetical protein
MNARGARHGYCPGDRSLFKSRSPRSRPEASRAKFPPTCTRSPPYDTGARPHMSYRLTRSTKKANHRTRSVQLPRNYAPLRLRSNQRSGRRTATQRACNRPAVKRSLIFAEKANRHAKSIQPPRGCAPLQLHCNGRSNMGAQAHMSYKWRVGYRVRKNRTAARANATSSRGRHERLKR